MKFGSVCKNGSAKPVNTTAYQCLLYQVVTLAVGQVWQIHTHSLLLSSSPQLSVSVEMMARTSDLRLPLVLLLKS